MAERYSGKALKVTFGGATPTDITGLFRVLEVEEGLRTVDATGGADTHERHLDDVLFGRATYTILTLPGSAGSALYNALAPRTAGTFIYYPQGTVVGTPAGNVKHTFLKAKVTGRTHRLVYNAAVEIRVGFEFDDIEVVAPVA